MSSQRFHKHLVVRLAGTDLVTHTVNIANYPGIIKATVLGLSSKRVSGTGTVLTTCDYTPPGGAAQRFVEASGTPTVMTPVSIPLDGMGPFEISNGGSLAIVADSSVGTDTVEMVLVLGLQA